MKTHCPCPAGDRARSVCAVIAVLAFVLCAVAWSPPSRAQSAPAGGDRYWRSRLPVELRYVRTIEPGDSVTVRSPRAVCFDHRGDLLVADTGNHRVLKFSAKGELLDQFGGYGWGAGQFDGPADVAVYEGFYIYVLDEGNRRILRYDPNGNYIDVLIGPDDVGSPVSMAVGRAGGLLVVDSDTQSVLAFSQFEEALEPVGQFGLDEGGLIAPVSVAVGPSREIAVADPGRRAVLVFDEFGSPLLSLSAPDTLLPLDAVIDRRGNVLVADGRRDRVLLFPPGNSRHLLSLETGFTPVALGLKGSGEVAVLDGATGNVNLIEVIYDVDTPEKHR